MTRGRESSPIGATKVPVEVPHAPRLLEGKNNIVAASPTKGSRGALSAPAVGEGPAKSRAFSREGGWDSPPEQFPTKTRSTTILAVKHGGSVVIAGDGQVTLGGTVVKATARKVRRMTAGSVIAGFAGSAADGMTLFERFESKLEEHGNNLRRAAVELAKDWRTDRLLRRLEAMLVVADIDDIFVLTGTGDVIQPDDGAVGIGSGGAYALAAARGLMRHTELGARSIVEAAMAIAAEICVYTNHELTIEELES